MNEAIPTPYDIASIAAIPFAPSMLAWGALALLALIAIGILWARTQPEKVKVNVSESARRAITQSLRSLSDATLDQSIWHSSSALKRYVAATDATPIDTLTPEELEALASSARSKRSAALLPIVAALDAQRFSPTRSLEDTRTLLQRAEHILRSEQ